MPPKKIVGGAKGGRPIGAKATKDDGVEAEVLHPELQSNWMELKPMVYDDEKIDDANEIHKLMKECAAFISKKEARNCSPFFKQLVDMFNVLAFNALKGTTACFKSVVKCEQIVKLWNYVITNFHVIEDYKEHALSHFVTADYLPWSYYSYQSFTFCCRNSEQDQPTLSLDGVVPAIHPTVMVQPASTAGKPTRRDERAVAASVPGTATHAVDDGRWWYCWGYYHNEPQYQ